LGIDQSLSAQFVTKIFQKAAARVCTSLKTAYPHQLMKLLIARPMLFGGTYCRSAQQQLTARIDVLKA
jgi:hypothetical protein